MTSSLHYGHDDADRMTDSRVRDYPKRTATLLERRQKRVAERRADENWAGLYWDDVLFKRIVYERARPLRTPSSWVLSPA